MPAETIDDYQVQHHLNEHHSSLGFRGAGHINDCTGRGRQLRSMGQRTPS